MVKFSVEKKTLLGRIGKIENWGSKEVNHSTPSCMTYLRAGHIPHLTWEVAENQLKLGQAPIFQMTLPSLVSQSKIIEKFGKGAPKFCGMPRNSAIHLTPLDPLGKLPGGYNDSKSIAIWTANGKVSLDVKTWRNIINSFGCDSFENLVDYDTPRDAGQKKMAKAAERTRNFVEQMMGQDEPISGERIVSLGGGFSKFYRRKSAVDIGLSENNVSGYSLEFHEFCEGKEKFEEKEVKELLEETFSPLPPSKLRCIFGPLSPKSVVFLVSQGIDMFDSSFPIKLAEEGHAFCLADNFPTSSDFDVVDFNDSKFADDFTTPFEGCGCYTCQKYTKGYLQHLLNTKELLASILLVIHNLTEYDRMFKLIRNSLENTEGL